MSHKQPKFVLENTGKPSCQPLHTRLYYFKVYMYPCCTHSEHLSNALLMGNNIKLLLSVRVPSANDFYLRISMCKAIIAVCHSQA